LPEEAGNGINGGVQFVSHGWLAMVKLQQLDWADNCIDRYICGTEKYICMEVGRGWKRWRE
jgi:hypothetical protein